MSMYTFNQLKKNLTKSTSGLEDIKLAILGDCATQHLVMAIKGYGYEAGLHLLTYEAGYDQIDAQVLDSSSELYEFEPQNILIYMCVEKLHEDFGKLPASKRGSFAEDKYKEIAMHWSFINDRIEKVNILQFTFIEADDKVFGNYALKTQFSFLYQVKKLNYLLSCECQQIRNIHLIDLNTIHNMLGHDTFYDSKLYYTARMPMSLTALPVVAKSVVDTLRALSGHFKKCVILDLDNTLWGGVVGEDGANGIQIGELGMGRAFSDFQMWLGELKNRGIILAVCSKNDEQIAKEPFLKNPEMKLRLEDISMFVANWEDKVSNILTIQKTLNIGMDSIVFLDDSPFERNLVRSMIPDITVPELPEDPAEYLSFLTEENLFETVSFSEEDGRRTGQYQAEIGRARLQQQFQTYDDYLLDLKMVATVEPFDEFYYPRIAQLTQRSNQFNLRTVRYTETEIENIAKDTSRVALYFTLRDRFGDYGLISVVVMDKQNNGVLFISEWVMSCRVLKRSMEEFIINKIMQTARENHCKKVKGEYIPTSKNAMVKDLYVQMGFCRVDENQFEIDLKDFVDKKTYIKEGTI